MTVGVALIGVPLLVTLYLSVFNEKLILFPPLAEALAFILLATTVDLTGLANAVTPPRYRGG